jgi:methanogenic corrinoid protein MtbC1
LATLPHRVHPLGVDVKKVMLFGVENEQHYIGIKMTADVFRDHGWKVRYHGPNLPVEHSMKQVHLEKPHVIGVSAALSYRLPVLKKMIQRFEQLEWKPFIMIGGRMARQLDLDEFESDRVMVVKGLSHLNRWFMEGREQVIDETS